MTDEKQAKYSGRTILTDQWLAMLDLLKTGAFTIDLLRRITASNHSARNMLGLPNENLIGRDCREVFQGVPCGAYCPYGNDVREEPELLEIELSDEDGNSHMVTRLTTPLYDGHGRLDGHLIVLQDRPSLADLINRVNYGEKSLKIILDRLDLAVFTINRGGHITFFNDAAESLTGRNRIQVLGKSGSYIFGSEDNPAWRDLKQSLAEGAPFSSSQIKIATAEGEPVEVKPDFIPLTNNREQIVGGLVTLHDLTLALQLDEAITGQTSFHKMVGKDPVMRRIFETVTQVAPSDATVLIEGATGTGKDLLAKVIHAASQRRDCPLVKVNCAALPHNLLESEMFGYVKGAFTGAERDKPGRFQEAEGGTIFLDEIGDLPLPLQAKLLRVLEDREFYPLGSRHTCKVDVRIIAATNRNLEDLLTDRLFREDLFYRLNVCRIELPPLKRRRADLPLLIRLILRRLCAVRDRRPLEISAKAMELLLGYDYPGNVRELENILEYAVLTCQGDRIMPEHIQSYVQTRTTAARTAREYPPESRFASQERQHILDILDRHQWRRKRAAQALGMDRTTLWRKMKKYGLTA